MAIWISLKKKLQKLKMRNQIFLMKILVLLISFIFIGCCYALQNNIIIDIFESSSKVVLQKQDRKSLQLMLPQLNYYIISKQQARIQLLTSIATFYKQIGNLQIKQSLQDSLPCELPEEIDFLFQIPQPCYSCFLCMEGNIVPEQQKYQDLRKLERVITEFIFSFDTLQKNRIFYMATGDILFGYMYPQITYNWSYQPTKLNWFTNHLLSYEEEPNQDYFFSQLYFSGVSLIYKQTITYSIKNSINNLLDAIAATDIDAEDWNMKSIKANTYLINQQGQIIYRNVDLYFSLKELNFIYEENKTGFNQIDWAQIQNLANGHNISSNCYKQELKILCRYNSIYKEPIKIVAKRIPGNFTLMMFTNSSFEKNLEIQFTQMENQIYEHLKQDFYSQIFFSLIIIFVSMIIVILMFRPILKVMLFARLYIKQMGNNFDKEIFKLANQISQRNDLIGQLQVQILNFGNIIQKSQQSKSRLCKMFEEFQYQQKPFNDEQSELLKQISLMQLEEEQNQKFPQQAINQLIISLLKQTNQIHHSQQ